MNRRKAEIEIVSAVRRQVSYGDMKKFEELTEREVLALAIALEEEDERVYSDFAEGLRQDYPATASMFDGMREEESGHRRRLLELFQKKFGEHIPLIRRQDVRGFVDRPALWLCARKRRPWKSRRDASTRRLRPGRRTRASANYWMIWPGKSANMKSVRRNWINKNFRPM